jgi:hypothetical protein
MRFYAEVIDLCQAPGLAQRARACLVRAADVSAARRCPSIPATADTSTADADAGPPSCGTIIAHAMRVLAQGPDAPVSATERAEEEQLFMRDCAAASAKGRRCAMRAVTVDAIDECLALPDDSDGEGEGDGALREGALDDGFD